MADDAILKVFLTKGVDVMAVAHAGYTIPAHIRSALELRAPTSIVPGCDIRQNLQIDHRNRFNRTRVTRFEDLASLPLPPPPENVLRVHVLRGAGNLELDSPS